MQTSTEIIQRTLSQPSVVISEVVSKGKKNKSETVSRRKYEGMKEIVHESKRAYRSLVTKLFQRGIKRMKNFKRSITIPFDLYFEVLGKYQKGMKLIFGSKVLINF